mmetsp:Transcript_26170/g.60830  ORF Transcript_26170/g.60830 Transcript_26170/m.60830 type:complete len:103 (+) Transcript_26170:232-540(+)
MLCNLLLWGSQRQAKKCFANRTISMTKIFFLVLWYFSIYPSMGGDAHLLVTYYVDRFHSIMRFLSQGVEDASLVHSCQMASEYAHCQSTGVISSGCVMVYVD